MRSSSSSSSLSCSVIKDANEFDVEVGHAEGRGQVRREVALVQGTQQNKDSVSLNSSSSSESSTMAATLGLLFC